MRTLILFFCLFQATATFAQQPDTLVPAPDTVPVAVAPAAKSGFVRRILTKDYPNPKTALLLSFALPGAGQAYNRKWWKLPIVYATLGGLTYLEISNIRQYRLLRDNYKWLVDGDPNTNPTEAPYTSLDATSMRQYRDQWRRYVEQSSLVLGLAYVLTATEAYVNAHLSHFDVSDDLTMQVKPSVQSFSGNSLAFGMGVALQFGGSRGNEHPIISGF